MLVVPYGAGLGINDVLECGGPGYTIDNLTDPPNGTVVKTPNDFGAFGYTPDPGFTGSDSFTYTLFQGSEVADQATAHITVTESCSVIAFSDLYITAYETSISEPAAGFLTNDTVECQPVTASVSINPTDGVVTAGPDGAFVYTPNPGFYFTDEFTYEIRDANQVVMATSVVTVVVDEPPCIAVDDAYSTTVDTALTVAAPGVLVNDSVCPTANDVQVAQPAAFGTVTLQPDGSLGYVPDPGFVGQDSFTYDLWGFDPATFTDVVLATATVLIEVTETPATTTTTIPPDTTTTVTSDTATTTMPPGSTTTSMPSDVTMTTSAGGPPTSTVHGPGPADTTIVEPRAGCGSPRSTPR